MTLDSTAGSPSPASAASIPTAAGIALPRRSIGQLVAISIFWFALNFHWAALPIFIIPAQVYGLLLQEAPGATLAERAAFVSDPRIALAQTLVQAPGLIVALLGNPYFGLLSDRTRGRLGRRRPYILGGTALNVVGLLMMALLPDLFVRPGSGSIFTPSLLILMVALMVVQFANNAAAAPFHALLPDMVPPEQRGIASGIMGLAFWVGSITGAIVPTLTGINSNALREGTQSYGDYQHGIVLSYGITIAVIVVMAALTLVFVRETPWQPSTMTASRRSEEARTARTLVLTILAVLGVVAASFALFSANLGLSLDDTSLRVLELVALAIAGYGAARAFQFRPRANPDFSWVVATRMAVMMGVYIVQVFLFQYMLNVAKAPNPQEAQTIFIILLTLAATASTLFAGWASDRVGRKRMVYISGTFMAIVGATFILTPYVAPSHILEISYIGAAIFGLGYGAYISVDWALVADVLPSEATFARDMGVWNIALTLPQVLAFVFGSVLIALGASLGHPILGYTFLFVSFVLFCVLGTVTVRYIRGVKR